MSDQLIKPSNPHQNSVQYQIEESYPFSDGRRRRVVKSVPYLLFHGAHSPVPSHEEGLFQLVDYPRTQLVEPSLFQEHQGVNSGGNTE